MLHTPSRPRLGINIDHVATLRNARGGTHPCPLRAAKAALHAGADGITAHLREDRRHIRDEDVLRLKSEIKAPLNLEMAATAEMLKFALEIKPHAVCLVPERRAELTTEGGLDVAGNLSGLKPFVDELGKAGIRVSLFLDPDAKQINAAQMLNAPVVELHTGSYAHAETSSGIALELIRLQDAATLLEQCGIECHAGHGLNFQNVAPVAAIKQVRELNIGHFLMGEALFIGMEAAIQQMLQHMSAAP